MACGMIVGVAWWMSVGVACRMSVGVAWRIHVRHCVVAIATKRDAKTSANRD